MLVSMGCVVSSFSELLICLCVLLKLCVVSLSSLLFVVCFRTCYIIIVCVVVLCCLFVGGMFVGFKVCLQLVLIVIIMIV